MAGSVRINYCNLFSSVAKILNNNIFAICNLGIISYIILDQVYKLSFKILFPEYIRIKIYFGEALLKVTFGVLNPWEGKPTSSDLRISCNEKEAMI